MDPSRFEQTPSWLEFVGCFATRVTLYSQQVRALNLIHELIERGRIPEAKSATVAIIGAGAAGVTAATALALAKPDVTIDILETRGKILDLQRGSPSRYLRPHIYDWPAATADQNDAGLPILNWTSNTAEEVAAKIAAEFKTLAGWDEERVRLLRHHEVKEVKACKSFYDVTVEDHTKKETLTALYRQ